MPQRKHRLLSFAGRLVFLALLGWALALVRAVRRSGQGWDEWSDSGEEWKPSPLPEDDDYETSDEQSAARRPFRARLVMSSAFVLIFFAAATFTAGAGDVIAKALDPAKCAALMQTTGEDESVCADYLAAPDATPEAAPEAAPAAEAPAVAVTPQASTEARTPIAAADPSAAPEATAPEATTPETTTPEGQAVDPAATADPSSSATTDTAGATDQQAPAVDQDDNPASYVLAPTVAPAKAKKASRHWVVRRAREAKAKAPVVDNEGGAATVWLNRALPDPTPPAKRLSPKFAKRLQHISAVNGVSWALVLGVLRAEGETGRVPATVRELNTLARGLRIRGAADNEWNAALALSGRSSFADRAVALARYNRAIGLEALVDGLEAAKARLTEETLADSRIQVYGPGRDDLENNRIDVRVIVAIRYLAESYGEVTVSCLFSGHRKYARPGVVSAHIYGHAVDISAVGGTSILGHQQPGSITEKAVRSILMLPVEVQPRQVISLLGMGGPSFPLSDHANHIHIGY
jgi:hypothetical protein